MAETSGGSVENGLRGRKLQGRNHQNQNRIGRGRLKLDERLIGYIVLTVGQL